MIRSLTNIGNSKGLILTRTMLEHLGANDAVKVSMESGCIVLTTTAEGAVRPRKRQTAEEAHDATLAQYGPALQKLADA